MSEATDYSDLKEAYQITSSQQSDELSDGARRILQLARSHDGGVNFPHIESIVTDLSREQVENRLDELQERNLVYIEKEDGFKWVKAVSTEQRSTSRYSVDLRQAGSRSNPSGESPAKANLEGLNGKLPDGPSEYIGGLKKRARKIVRSYTEIPQAERDELNDLFMAYLEEINDLQIVMKRKEGTDYEKTGLTKDAAENDSEYLMLDYLTRFNSASMRSAMWGQYFTAWTKATEGLDGSEFNLGHQFDEEEGYNQGVFLTLTTDPKRFKNNQQAVKHISKAFNRFMSWLSRRIEREKDKEEHERDMDIEEGIDGRPPYLKVLEYTKDGKPHLHVALFGINRIASKGKVSQMWSKYGQGEIVDLHKIENDDGEWVWPQSNPDDAEDDDGDSYDVITYMSNEFSKSFKEKSSLALHWIYQTRFFTLNKDLKAYTCRSDDCGCVFDTKGERDEHERRCFAYRAALEACIWVDTNARERLDDEILADNYYMRQRKVKPPDLFGETGEMVALDDLTPDKS